MSNHSTPRRSGSRTSKQTASKGVAAGAALLALASVGLVTSTGASAGVIEPTRVAGVVHPQVAGEGDTWLGGYSIPGLNGAGSMVFCAQNSNNFYPSVLPEDYAPGVDSSDAISSAIAYAIQNYAGLSNENAAAVDGIVSYFNPDMFPEDYVWAGEMGFGDLSSGLMGLIWADSQAHAGPYSITFTGLNEADSDPSYVPGGTYTATVHVQGANGPITGIVPTLSADSGAILGPVGATDGAGNATFTWSLPAPAESFTVTGGASAPALRTWTSYFDDNQSLRGVSSTPSQYSGSGVGHVHIDPIIAASFTKLIAGQENLGPQIATFSIENTTAGWTQTITTVAGGPTNLDGISPGDQLIITELVAPAGAYIPADPFLVTVPADAADGFAFVLTDPANPVLGIQTQVNQQQAVVGRQLTDVVRVTGNDGQQGTITGTLYGPVAPNADGSPLTDAQYLAAPSQTFTAPLNGNEDVTIVGPVVTEAGIYGWAESVTLTPSGVTIDSPPTAPNESTIVTQPEIKTQISQQTGVVGAKLSDTIVVTGATENIIADGVGGTAAPLTSTIEASLYYKPFVDDATDCSALTMDDWAEFVEAHADAEVYSETLSIQADGTVTTGEYTVPEGGEGCYTWAEVMTPEVIADQPGTAPETVTYPGEVTESATIIEPEVTTKIGESDGTIKDTAIVTGTHGIPVVVKIDLQGPLPAIDGSCDAVVFDASSPSAGSFDDIVTNGDGEYVTSEIVVPTLAAGTNEADTMVCYSAHEALWTVATPTIPSEEIYTSSYGVPSETTVVNIGGGGSKGNVPAPVAAGGGRIDTGLGAESSSATSIAVAGGGLLLLVGAGAAMAAARRRTAE